MKKRLIFILACIGLVWLAACNAKAPSTAPTVVPSFSAPSSPTFAPTLAGPESVSTPTLVPTLEPPAERLLTVCLGREPESLFLYSVSSASAQSILQAVYDGPFDLQNFDYQPVILTKRPSLADGDLLVEPVPARPGNWIVDADGNLAVLAVGVKVRASGCQDANCALTYAGDQPVLMDQLVARFTLRPGITWSDGAPLTADDSLYSFEVAQALFSGGQFGRLDFTAAYKALDATTVEWRGVPGFLGAVVPHYFFSPLPRHAWGSTPPQDLAASEGARLPLGWGAYVIDQWVPEDHITLRKNPAYFRATEGLPHFDRLVFRFMFDDAEALDALMAGECDVIDTSASANLDLAHLLDLQSAGKVALSFQSQAAWEIAAFGINSLGQGPGLFQQKEVRQALAMCVDRQAMVDKLMFGQAQVPASYLPPSHPLADPNIRQYAYDPQAASALLQTAGWIDADGDPATPRVSQGVLGVTDGTPLEFSYLTAKDGEREAVAQILQISLAQCGAKVNLVFDEAVNYLSAGPEGPVFGRRFQMAQFAFPFTAEPACSLFQSQEIPGPFPEFPKGWGGMNAAGYRNEEFDQVCTRARTTLPGSAEYLQAQARAQTIFTEELPVLPLYTRFKVVINRPALCGLSVDSLAGNPLAWLEQFDADEGCK